MTMKKRMRKYTKLIQDKIMLQNENKTIYNHKESIDRDICYIKYYVPYIWDFMGYQLRIKDGY